MMHQINKLIFVPYSLGKFYIYNKGNIRYNIIEMNRFMYDFDKELFFWVLRHELKHHKHYQEPETEGKPDPESELEQQERTLNNFKMKKKLFAFQLKYPMTTVVPFFITSLKRYSVNEDKSLLTNGKDIDYFRCIKIPEEEERKVRFYLDGL